ncbi:hypothetical protein [Novosphingobium sp. Fuku2-ISO-50]|uniref:hypothetical protein n=1 Tax=Novosphingobium sp. Fuku2-ISO-50 TaxID=1739114 RepID=UPI000A7047B6|nr:hypothetical protein [Novosphingobium sp. Fuku2-ISO-50]
MADLTHTDLHRDMGRMEGRLAAMEDRFGRMEQTLDRIDQRLAKIESKESQLRGGWFVLAGIAAVAGAVLLAVVEHYWK